MYLGNETLGGGEPKAEPAEDPVVVAYQNKGEGVTVQTFPSRADVPEELVQYIVPPEELK